MKRTMKLNQYSKELIGNKDLLGALGIESINNTLSSPLYKLDNPKKVTPLA